MDVAKIQYIDGIRFKRAVIAGANWVIQMQKHLDDINVFPVPDSDTGTNMASTMKSVAEGVLYDVKKSIHEVSEIIAESALMGARGNSGAILAQFFQGLAEGLKGHWKVSTDVFGSAAAMAAEWSEEAISKPREGTILTVIRDWADHVKVSCSKREDFVDLLRGSLRRAKESLKQTPEKLKLLKKAGVVDAGAQGFVYLLEGIAEFIEKGQIDKEFDVDVPDDLSGVAHVDEAPGDIHHRYCTECLIAGEKIDRKSLREKLETIGDSIIVAGSDKKVRIHIHTNNPRDVFEMAENYAEILEKKVDDMRQQHRDAFGDVKHTIAIITDTACDLPEEIIQKYNIHRIPIRLNFGEENYIDTFTISIDEFYQKLVDSDHHPKTSQPTPGDFKRTYELVTKHYDTAISIHIPGKVSGTLQSAKKTAKTVSDKITVIDGKSLSVGLGLIALEGARAVENGLKHDEVIHTIQDAVKKLKLFISVDTMDYLVRGGRVSRMKGVIAKLFSMKPILTFDEEGNVEVLGKAVGGQNTRNKMMKLIIESAMGKKNLRFAVAHGNAPDSAQWYVEQINREIKPAEVIQTEISPALGVHGGPGAIGVAYIGD